MAAPTLKSVVRTAFTINDIMQAIAELYTNILVFPVEITKLATGLLCNPNIINKIHKFNQKLNSTYSIPTYNVSNSLLHKIIGRARQTTIVVVYLVVLYWLIAVPARKFMVQ